MRRSHLSNASSTDFGGDEDEEPVWDSQRRPAWPHDGEDEEDDEGPREGRRRRSMKWELRHDSMMELEMRARTYIAMYCPTAYEFATSFVRRACSATDQSVLVNFVRGSRFEVFASLLIMANAAFIGYTASAQLHATAASEDMPSWIRPLQIFFVCAFVCELLFRLFAERELFFTGRERTWNAFDSVLIAFSVLDAAFQEAPAEFLPIARMLRLLRFLRILRITRVMKQLKSMRLVVLAILGSMTSVLWSFVIIGILMYIFSVVLLYSMSEFFQQADTDPNDPLSKELMDTFGGVYLSMTALFMSISGGADWHEFMVPLVRIHPLWGPLFMGYIFFMSFGVMNVVVAAVVATTAEVQSQDQETFLRQELSNIESYQNKVKQFFKEADYDNSGTLSWEEFESHMRDGKVKAFFSALQLDVSKAHILFELLDTDGSNEVNLDEFLEGCIRLKGQARSIDLNLLLLQSEKLASELRQHIKSSTKEFRALRQFVTNRKALITTSSAKQLHRPEYCRPPTAS